MLKQHRATNPSQPDYQVSKQPKRTELNHDVDSDIAHDPHHAGTWGAGCGRRKKGSLFRPK